MTKPTIIITGANGYLGNSFVHYFAGLGWGIKAFVHRVPKIKIDGVAYVNYSLEKELNEDDFEDVDAVVHAAYVRFDKNKEADKINYEGTDRLIAVCENKNVPIVFLSSFSAHEEAVSHYGTSKVQCERLFDTTKHTILKIGFIVGPGGILGEMRQQMLQSQFFPLVGGHQPLQSIGMDDLYKVMTIVVEKKLTGVFHIAHQEVLTMKAFYEALAVRLNRKITFIPIPMNLLYRVCKVFEFLKIPIPVSSESVLGLKKLTIFKTEEAQKLLGFRFKNHEECFDAIFGK